jgi:retrotransposon gag protein
MAYEEPVDVESIINALTDIVEQLSLTIRNSGILNQSKTNAPNNDRLMNIDVPDFDGTTGNPDDYVEWENSLERYFDYKETPEDQKFRIAKVKLTRLSAIWLEGLQKQRKREERPRLNSWEKLRKHLRRKYVPSTYKQQRFVKWGNLRQGSMTVSEYIQERERLAILCDINEPEEMKIGRCLGGLRDEIREKLEPIQNLTYDGAYNSALVYEKHEKGRSQQGFKSNRPPPQVRSNPGSFPRTNKPSNPRAQTRDKGTSPSKDVICFKCHGHGHYKNECPNGRAFTQKEWLEINGRIGPRAMLVLMNGQEELVLPPTPVDGPEGTYVVNNLGKMELAGEDLSEEEDVEQLYPEEETHGLLVRRNFHATPKCDKTSQRENIFQTKCKVDQELCDLII